jgi:hypothetical protein
VPGLQGMCALVSKEWQQLFREWRDKEIEKRLRSMCRGLIYRALDMCEKGEHVLWTKVSRGLKLSLKRVDTPRHGWKNMHFISDAELEQWRVWADAEFEAQFAWIQGRL